MTIEEKTKEFAEGVFHKALSAPWPECKQLFAEAYLAGAEEAQSCQWRDVARLLPEEDKIEAADTGISLTVLSDFLVRVEYENGEYDYLMALRKRFHNESEWVWWDSERDRVIYGVTHWMQISEPSKTEDK